MYIIVFSIFVGFICYIFSGFSGVKNVYTQNKAINEDVKNSIIIEELGDKEIASSVSSHDANIITNEINLENNLDLVQENINENMQNDDRNEINSNIIILPSQKLKIAAGLLINKEFKDDNDRYNFLIEYIFPYVQGDVKVKAVGLEKNESTREFLVKNAQRSKNSTKKIKKHFESVLSGKRQGNYTTYRPISINICETNFADLTTHEMAIISKFCLSLSSQVWLDLFNKNSEEKSSVEKDIKSCEKSYKINYFGLTCYMNLYHKTFREVFEFDRDFHRELINQLHSIIDLPNILQNHCKLGRAIMIKIYKHLNRETIRHTSESFDVFIETVSIIKKLERSKIMFNLGMINDVEKFKKEVNKSGSELVNIDNKLSVIIIEEERKKKHVNKYVKDMNEDYLEITPAHDHGTAKEYKEQAEREDLKNQRKKDLKSQRSKKRYEKQKEWESNNNNSPIENIEINDKENKDDQEENSGIDIPDFLNNFNAIQKYIEMKKNIESHDVIETLKLTQGFKLKPYENKNNCYRARFNDKYRFFIWQGEKHLECLLERHDSYKKRN